MASHDRYDTDILKALQRIAGSLDRIEKKLPDSSISLTMAEPGRNYFHSPGDILLCEKKADTPGTEE